ncbi:DUF308 domain-containing protein [Roseibium sp. FZY0029]|uniref:HdeD family acid-resistance protein n=1 Tax=Roseibium sp. FZY0029 TaxID=3116647 RepID=UPI002EBC7C69|nr:DUF308 domain-containing protein [Roseibium sp. FZY0029]
MNTKTAAPLNCTVAQQATRRLTIIGVVFVVVGLLVMLLPSIATLAAERLVASMLILWGGAGLWCMVEMRSAPEWRYGAGAFAFMLIVGLIFVIFPVAGIGTLSILMIIAFLIEGIVFILLGLRSSSYLANWRWLVSSGACSLIVGLIVVLGWPNSAPSMLGLLLGANFLSNGLSLVMLSRSGRATT